ncbi:GMP/IMP nucleotidase [Salinicola acroporae]|uniref:Haloacid dehalogenase n=1 Tax=Salinicola acroporae TaxID=1541440 RepID=A0ABT6I409_9GAMM|nr:GMP/IMP nucleotidase [Salinicola acroporae]MDH4572356.1 haloacid dehalogenase [Salinicola acroporae]
MIDWSAIDTVFLDMDGTLLDLHFDSHFWLEHLPRRYVELHRLDDTHRTALESRIHDARGTLDWYSLAYWSRELSLDIVVLKREVAHLIGWRADALAFMEWLKASPLDVVLATNADRESLGLKLPLTGLDRYVDRIVSSADVGVPKEQLAFWSAMQTLHPFDPARSLFIDDNADVLESARRYGIRHLLGIHQPDSRKVGSDHPSFTVIEQFASLLPARPG